MPGSSEPRASLLRQAVRYGIGACLPRHLFMTSGPSGSRRIALTFDDGPHPTHTPAVLDRLRAHGVRATFFVIGWKAEAYPSLLRRIADEGHEIGQHSYAHGSPEATSAGTLVAEARRTSALLVRLVGKRPSLYRPPYGKLTPAKLLGLWSLGQTIVLWNRDPKDFASTSSDAIRQWFEAARLRGGDILLLHDVHAQIAPALDAVVDRAASLRLEFGTPAEWRA